MNSFPLAMLVSSPLWRSHSDGDNLLLFPCSTFWGGFQDSIIYLKLCHCTTIWSSLNWNWPARIFAFATPYFENWGSLAAGRVVGLKMLKAPSTGAASVNVCPGSLSALKCSCYRGWLTLVLVMILVSILDLYILFPTEASFSTASGFSDALTSEIMHFKHSREGWMAE